MKYFYKNFETTLKFSKEDNLFYGKIENVRDLILFDGNTETEAIENFHQAVDDYSQNIIHTINYHLAKLFLKENITDKTFDGMPLSDYIENQKQVFKELLGERFTQYNENYVGELLVGIAPKVQQEQDLNDNQETQTHRLKKRK